MSDELKKISDEEMDKQLDEMDERQGGDTWRNIMESATEFSNVIAKNATQENKLSFFMSRFFYIAFGCQATITFTNFSIKDLGLALVSILAAWAFDYLSSSMKKVGANNAAMSLARSQHKAVTQKRA